MIIARQITDLSECRASQGQSPFQSLEYLTLYLESFSKTSQLYMLGVYDEARMVAWGAFELMGKKAVLLGMKPVLGSQEVTDFGDITLLQPFSPEIWTAITSFFVSTGIDEIQLDYVREDSETYKYFSSVQEASLTKQETSPFILLPQTWDLYLESLERTDRKELKRKLKRIETHQTSLIRHETVDDTLFETFIDLHRKSDFAKEKFMTEEMKSFFKKLISTSMGEWKPILYELKMNEKSVAMLFAFENTDTILGYNSGFDPEEGYYSVGLMLKAMLIRTSIEEGKKKIDFLRGNERYKYDLGARDLNLYRIVLNPTP